MKCYDKEGKLVPGELLLAPRAYPEHGVFRDENNKLYMVQIEGEKAFLKNGNIKREKAFIVAEQCIVGLPIQGSMSEAMNAMAVTMLVTLLEYEQRLSELEIRDT